MRVSLCVLALGCAGLSSACASMAMPPPQASVTPAPPATAGCDPQAARSAIGKAASPAALEQARRDTGARSARVIRPGQMVTLEYQEGRLNVHVNERNAITSLTCG